MKNKEKVDIKASCLHFEVEYSNLTPTRALKVLRHINKMKRFFCSERVYRRRRIKGQLTSYYENRVNKMAMFATPLTVTITTSCR